MTDRGIFDDPEIARQVAIIVEHMYENLQGSTTAAEALSRVVKEGGEKAEKSLNGLSEQFQGTIDMANKGADDISQKWRRFKDDVTQGLHDIENTPGAKMFFGDKQGGAITGMVGGLVPALRSVRTELFGGLPFGGLLGLLLAGRDYEAQATASGMKAVNIFRSVGDSFNSSIGYAVGDRIKKLETKIPEAGAQVKAIFDTMAGGGVRAGQMFQEFGHNIEGFGSKVYEVSQALDNMWRVQGGTNARLSLEMTQNTGESIRDTTELIAKLGFEAKDSGLNFTTFVGQINQVSNALRFQRADAKDTAAAFKMIREASGNVYAGADSLTQGMRAAEGAQGAARMIGGMSEALQAVIGQRIAARYKMGNIDELDAILKMAQGFRDKQGNEQVPFVTAVLQEIRSLVKQQTGDRPGMQFQGFTKLFNADQNTARIMMDLSNTLEETGKLSAEQYDEFNRIMEGKKGEQDPLFVLMNDIKILISKIGEFLLTLVGTVVREIIEIGRLIGEGFGGKGWIQALKDFDNVNDAIGQNLKASVDGVVDATKSLGPDVIKVLEPLWLGGLVVTPGGGVDLGKHPNMQSHVTEREWAQQLSDAEKRRQSQDSFSSHANAVRAAADTQDRGINDWGTGRAVHLSKVGGGSATLQEIRALVLVDDQPGPGIQEKAR